MICDICKKKPAVIHYAEVINNKVKKINLCEECAAAKGISEQQPFSIGELFSGLTPQKAVPSAADKITCPVCRMSFAQFKETGRLGCSQCYESFKKPLMSLIESIHRSTRHIGKVPSGKIGVQDNISKIQELEEKLRQAIEKEEYEEAARIRDEIRAMEKKGLGKIKKIKGKG